MATDSESLTTELPTIATVVTTRKRKPAVVEVVSIPVKLEVESGTSHLLLERLLAMAHGYRSDGKLHEAMEIYWELVENREETSEAKVASNILLEMAAGYERGREPRMARSIYERLLTD